jgi:hypothetical protein
MMSQTRVFRQTHIISIRCPPSRSTSLNDADSQTPIKPLGQHLSEDPRFFSFHSMQINEEIHVQHTRILQLSESPREPELSALSWMLRLGHKSLSYPYLTGVLTPCISTVPSSGKAWSGF